MREEEIQERARLLAWMKKYGLDGRLISSVLRNDSPAMWRIIQDMDRGTPPKELWRRYSSFIRRTEDE